MPHCALFAIVVGGGWEGGGGWEEKGGVQQEVANLRQMHTQPWIVDAKSATQQQDNSGAVYRARQNHCCLHCTTNDISPWCALAATTINKTVTWYQVRL